MDADRFLRDYADVAAALLERHYSIAKEWFPHEHVPWARGRDFRADEVVDPDKSGLDSAVRSALWLNLLTEDNLPHYFHASIGLFQSLEPWTEWERQWMAEEGRHSIVIRDYVTIMRLIDPVALERARVRLIKTGFEADVDGPLDAVVYAAIQELATRIAHRNTATRLDDAVGYGIMARVAADENLHHLFFRDVTTAVVERDPSHAVRAIARQVRRFQMPGLSMDGYQRHARAAADAGIYNASIHCEQILIPLVLRHWRIEELERLDDGAERARDSLVRSIRRLQRAAAADQERRTARAALAGPG